MKNLPSKTELDIMWTVATSGALETGTRPHYGFAEMLYDYLTNKQLPVGLYDFERKESTTQET